MLVILIAPNVSERMGGEAIKSLQIYEELEALGVPVHQISHARVRDEMRARNPDMKITYIEDGPFQRFLFKTRVFKILLVPMFTWKAARAARELIREHPGAVVHINSPVSPVVPLPHIEGVPVIVGPLNGNIHHPPAFRNREHLADSFRRMLLRPAQLFFRTFFRGKQAADVLLVAGGDRTYESLRMAGCRDAQFVDSLDSGIPNRLRDQPPVEHVGRNIRFVHNGRLVGHKGTDLILKALVRTRNPIELDVIGRGPEKANLERLTDELKLRDRVKFIEWFENHADLQAALRTYRGFVLPSLAEANGIVVQEAMMMGLPVICANWGGPSLLVTPRSGFLLPVDSEESLVSAMADAMDKLADDPDLANSMAQEGRAIALERGFAWADLIGRWIAVYHEAAGRKAARPRV